MELTWDGILGFVGSIIGVYGAFRVASWQNNASERNKVLLELHKMNITIKDLKGQCYGTNDGNYYDGPMDIYGEYILPLEEGRDYLIKNYPIINKKLSSRIEDLTEEIHKYRQITGQIIFDHNATEKVVTDGKNVLLQVYSFDRNQKFLDQEKRLLELIGDIENQINNPLKSLAIPFRKYIKPPTEQ